MGTQLADYFKTGLGFVQQFVIPAAVIGLQFTPAGPAATGIAVATKVYQSLPDIMAMTERICTEHDGPTKKVFALGVAQQLSNLVSGVSGGGQKETWDKISGGLGMMIDQSIAAINAHKSTEGGIK